jgi:disulfide bond formation protein DsbB
MTVFLQTIHSLTCKRWPWLLLVAIALALEGVALYLQHALQVEPCNECIYVRAGVLALGVAGLLGSLAPRFLIVRLLALTGCLTALGWSLYRIELLLGLEQIVREGGDASCKRFKGFPDWMPLDSWLPEAFEPRAMCGTVSWTFWGQSVTFWIGAALLAIAVVACVGLVAQVSGRHTATTFAMRSNGSSPAQPGHQNDKG